MRGLSSGKSHLEMKDRKKSVLTWRARESLRLPGLMATAVILLSAGS